MSLRDRVDAGAERVCQLVGALDVPSPWDLDVFISTTAQARGKPIWLIPHSGLSGPGQPCGVWIGRHTDDIIDPATVTHVLNRTSYDTEQESQAELFASLIMSESRKAYTASKFLRTFLRD
ncbi:hypothetical protein [Mycobacterium haemophilum]|uniref:hypothetical protein n=1 Tax=Mycobacterium haemophilum TaxID=29311 RepID=UPI0006427BD5|nr:hypothetical protein [Mycobacterium haemophilum]KLO30291.1 hypothetical protein ABH39_10655 [Mycobacterium haemophilum]KLO49664.1 hypothetical protein ABH36_11100 [Mycobacterium haemophilum]